MRIPASSLAAPHALGHVVARSPPTAAPPPAARVRGECAEVRPAQKEVVENRLADPDGGPESEQPRDPPPKSAHASESLVSAAAARVRVVGRARWGHRSCACAATPMATRVKRTEQAGVARRLAIGAECLPDGRVHFRVWAPRRRSVDVVLEPPPGSRARPAAVPLEAERDGYFSGFAPDAASSSRYRYRLDEGDSFPDPASRFQPDGPHGASEVIDSRTFRWTDAEWPGVRLEGAVLYELHVGTFTREGTWTAAAEQLSELASLGITCVEVMPVAEFPGRFGWGYDGVDLYAPTRLYGRPDDFRHFVDTAHSVGLGVILDVVYNHLGPDGNYVKGFSDYYFSKTRKTEWGEAFNFDGEHCAPVREFVTGNACYWVDEFHVDGLRLDATQSIFDDSPRHILTDIGEAMRAAAAGRSILLVGENEPQNTKLVRPVAEGGCGLDALWNYDFLHTALVALTG
jgi:maltooligosyltrehalose trehalohydrolase